MYGSAGDANEQCYSVETLRRRRVRRSLQDTDTMGMYGMDGGVMGGRDGMYGMYGVDARSLGMGVMEVCAEDSDCDAFQTCSNSTCTSPLKECAGNCSGHGMCTHKSADSGLTVSSCVWGDVSCRAQCRYGNGIWYMCSYFILYTAIIIIITNILIFFILHCALQLSI
jgi:hypothetical protein